MAEFTPFPDNPKEIAAVDGSEITADLFKDVCVPTTGDKLDTFLRIKPSNEDYHIWYQIANNTLYGNRTPYEFTRIFDEQTSQKEFYISCAHPLVCKFVEGNDCLLFAYGTTSSGKSYTIRGTPNELGVIPRAIHFLFNSVKVCTEPYFRRKNFRDFERLTPDEGKNEVQFKQQLLNSIKKLPNIDKFIESFKLLSFEEDGSRDNNVDFLFYVSFLEFYNEKLIDLLKSDTNPQSANLNIMSDGSANRLKHVFVSSAEEAFKVFLFGQENLNKHIQETKLNLHSSRSHSMFTISAITINSKKQSVIRVNNISFCDLAGVERCNKTESKGVRLKEAGKINNSLLTLNLVIMGIRAKQKRLTKNVSIPFRNSKLTKSFKPYLDGIGFASMIININPTMSLKEETLKALDFSATAAEIVVSSEDSRRQLQDSWKRLSQMWIESKQRWSSFLNARGHISKSNPVETILEDEEEADFSIEIDNEISELQSVNFFDLEAPQMVQYKKQVDSLMAQIEALQAKLEEADNEKFKTELQVRGEVADQYKQITNDMLSDFSKERENILRENAKITEQRLAIARERFDCAEAAYKEEIEKLNVQIFELKENIVELKENIVEYKLLNEELKKQIEETNAKIKKEEMVTKIERKDVQTCTINIELKEQSTITEENENLSHIGVNTEPVESIELKEQSTITENQHLSDIATNTEPFESVETKEQSTVTENETLLDVGTNTDSTAKEMMNKSTQEQPEPVITMDKGTRVSFYLEDKGTLTEDFSSSSIENENANSSRKVLFSDSSTDSPNSNSNVPKTEQFIQTEENFEQLLKQKDALIDLKQEITDSQQKRIKEMQNTIESLKKKIDELQRQNIGEKRIPFSMDYQSSSILSFPSESKKPKFSERDTDIASDYFKRMTEREKSAAVEEKPVPKKSDLIKKSAKKLVKKRKGSASAMGELDDAIGSAIFSDSEEPAQSNERGKQQEKEVSQNYFYAHKDFSSLIPNKGGPNMFFKA
ncbi:Kinesin-like KIF20B [Dinothrombium tinctorium]|uniref:Kinesin-like KIF20B n=1 Tax=Dinothrombium tinctorium TaxID=1965070 RepID=A0A443RG25_9ACAR|nr:Kinesin-like KIF20B [Dinothrombium tinctorium]